MTKSELWIGRVEVLTPPTDWGDTRAFTNVIAWAIDPDEFKMTVARIFEEYGWSLLGIETCDPVASRSGYDEKYMDAIERAKGNLDACIYMAFQYYPSKTI